MLSFLSHSGEGSAKDWMLMEQKESSHLFLLPGPSPIVVLFFLALLHIFEILQQFMVSQDFLISSIVKS